MRGVFGVDVVEEGGEIPIVLNFAYECECVDKFGFGEFSFLALVGK